MHAWTLLSVDWHAVYSRKHPDTDSPAHALAHVRALLPAGQGRNVSTVTTAWLTERLYAYPGAPATLLKVHASWSVFFDHCTRVRGLFPVNPMAAVEKPDVRRGPIQFYELEAAKQIVEAQPDPARRALLYGTGTEVSVALRLTRADVDPATKEIRAAGTKTYTRDRMARVADWAWPIFWSYAKDHLPTARLWRATLTRFTVSDWHRATVKELKLPAYPLKNARHHWAVRMLRNGAPIHVAGAARPLQREVDARHLRCFCSAGRRSGAGRGAGDAGRSGAGGGPGMRALRPSVRPTGWKSEPLASKFNAGNAAG